MKLETYNKDINRLEKALKLVQSCECNYLFDKSTIIFSIIENKNKLENKRDAQIKFLNSIN